MSAAPPSTPTRGPAPPSAPNSGPAPPGASNRGPAVMATPGAAPGNAAPGPKKVVRRVIRMPDGTLVDAPPAKSGGPPADPKKAVPVVKRVIQQPGGPNAPAANSGTGSKAIPVSLQAGMAPKPAAAPGTIAAKPIPGPAQTPRELANTAPTAGKPPTAPTNVVKPPQPIQPPNSAGPVAAKSVPTGAPNTAPVGLPKSAPTDAPKSVPASSNPIMTAVGAEVAVGVGKGINLMFDGLSKKINQATPAPKPAAKPTAPKPAAAETSRGPPAPGARSMDFAQYPPQQPQQYAQYPPQPQQYAQYPPQPQQYAQYPPQPQPQAQYYGQQYTRPPPVGAPAMGLNRDYYQPSQPTHSHTAAAGVAGVAGGLALGAGAVLAYDAVTDHPTGHSSTIINRDIDINTTVYNERPGHIVQSSYVVPQSYYQGGEVDIIETREVDAYGNVIEYETTEAEYDAFGNLVEYTTIEETPQYTTTGVKQLYDGEVVEEVEVQEYYVEGEDGVEITEYSTEVQYDVYGNIVEASTETEVQEYNEEGELIGQFEQTTIVDDDGEVQYETEYQTYNDNGELVEDVDQTTTVDEYGNVEVETEVQEYNDDGDLIESVDQTTTMDQYGNVEVETDVVEEDGQGGYTEEYQEETYGNGGDSDDDY